jgi:hypothetical protein
MQFDMQLRRLWNSANRQELKKIITVLPKAGIVGLYKFLNPAHDAAS